MNDISSPEYVGVPYFFPGGISQSLSALKTPRQGIKLHSLKEIVGDLGESPQAHAFVHKQSPTFKFQMLANICIHNYIYIYTVYACVCVIYVYIDIYTKIHVYFCIYIYMCVCLFIYIYIYKCIHAQMNFITGKIQCPLHLCQHGHDSLHLLS